MKHTKYTCGCARTDCHFCGHGLEMCGVCCALQATASTDCPGRMLTAEEMRALEAKQIDFRDGKWVRGSQP